MEKDDNIIDAEENVDAPPGEHKIDLRKIRESKGLTLREISRSTRISHTVLMMIETEEFESLPEPVYSVAFIKKYAEILGMDSEEILSNYNRYLKENKIAGKPDQRKKKSGIISNHSLVIGGACVIALVLIFIFYSFRQDYVGQEDAAQKQVVEETSGVPTAETGIIENLKEKESAEMPVMLSEVSPEVVEREGAVVHQQGADDEARGIEEFQKPITEKEERTESEKPILETELEKAITEAKVYKLTIRAKELTWLKISQDDADSLETMLRKGETIERKAMEKFRITIGNAGGVDVTFEGKSLGKLGAKGEVVHLDLP